MIVENIKDKRRWNDFLIANQGDFLQSWQWGEFQEKSSRKIFRLGVVDGSFKAAALAIKYELPFNKSYLYCGRFNFQSRYFKLLISGIKKIAEKENVIFFRIDLDVAAENKEAENFLKKEGFIELKSNGSAISQPSLVWQLNLAGEEIEIFSGMKEKARYNIRLAEKKGVKIRESKDLKDLDKFYSLARETSARDGFKLHPKAHYLKLFEILIKDNLGSLFLAEHEGDILSVIMVLFFNQKAVYLHGASSNKKRNLMANQLIQWEALKKAKERGCLVYDFGGVAPEGEPNHPWQGVSRFKKSFGGRAANYLSFRDLVFQPLWYRIYKIAKRLR
ncbi:MAG: putative methicillin resistance protein [Parcubacteria group bacterium Athens1014_10]|nr:MAG: putative methicillin resistance protein [Parcubacteria group bacterium Athens1014_10]TSD05884.1 MAG: putative methicillin resistance protein [Parcubacteria group bacterium Athens0714_12]